MLEMGQLKKLKSGNCAALGIPRYCAHLLNFEGIVCRRAKIQPIWPRYKLKLARKPLHAAYCSMLTLRAAIL